MLEALDQEAKLQQVLEELSISPQQLLDHHRNLAERVSSTPEWIDPEMHRSHGRFATPLRDWHINADALDSKLRNLLQPLGIGFCYVLQRKGRLVLKNSGGEARLPTPAISIGAIQIPAVPGLDWSENVTANLCSVSKLITAVAIVMLLRDQGIDPKSPVTAFLPSYWARPSSTDAVTFHDLLRHESGLGSGLTGSDPGDFANARDQFEKGSTGTGLTTFSYHNLNYTILRATFPILAGIMPADLAIPGLNDALWGLASATVYRDFVNRRICSPAGVGPFDFKADADTARAYGTPPAPLGAQLADVTSDAGSSGWHMSLAQLMAIVAEFRHGSSMMTPGQAQQLLAHRYGVNEIKDTKAGAIYIKRGRFNDGGSNTLDTGIYIIPDDFELGVFINSGPGSGLTQGSYNDTIAQLIADSALAN